jgi:dynein heavy chain
MSGEIIQMNSRQNMIFEPKDLISASPATVSRCGMIYLDPDSLGPSTLINAWIKYNLPKHLNSQQINIINALFNWLFHPSLEFVLENCDQSVFCSNMHLTISFLKLFTCMLDDIKFVE